MYEGLKMRGVSESAYFHNFEKDEVLWNIVWDLVNIFYCHNMQIL